MSSSDAMFEALSVYFGVDLGRSKSLIWSNFSCCRMAFDYRGFMNENQKALGVQG